MKLGRMPYRLIVCYELCHPKVGSAMKSMNHVRVIRESKLISKTELARLAGVSQVTIDRIERGEACRMETMRKIVLALGFTLADKDKVFPDTV